jgi:hypothetical protein
MAPQDFYADKSSISSNMAIGNSLESSGLQFGSILFYEKYSKNKKKYTLGGLLEMISFRGASFKNEENMNQRKYILVGYIQVDIT